MRTEGLVLTSVSGGWKGRAVVGSVLVGLGSVGLDWSGVSRDELGRAGLGWTGFGPELSWISSSMEF